jgi:hypothetical protein
MRALGCTLVNPGLVVEDNANKPVVSNATVTRLNGLAVLTVVPLKTVIELVASDCFVHRYCPADIFDVVEERVVRNVVYPN